MSEPKHDINETSNIAPPQSIDSGTSVESKKLPSWLPSHVDRLINKGNPDLLKNLKIEYQLSDSYIGNILVHKLSQDITGERGGVERVAEIIHALGLSDYTASSDQFQSIATKALLNRVAAGTLNSGDYHKYKSELSIHPLSDHARSKDIVMLAIKAVATLIRTGNTYVNPAIEIVADYDISPDVLISPEIQEAIKDGVIRCVEQGAPNEAFKIVEKFPLKAGFYEDEQLRKNISEEVVSFMMHGRIEEAMEMQRVFSLPDLKEENIAAIVHGLLGSGEIEKILKITGSFPQIESQIINIDNNFANKPIPSLLPLVRVLGNTDFIYKFPKTHAAVLQEMSIKIAYDLDLADYFVENLNNYYQQSWVAKNASEAVKHYSVAQKFIHAAKSGQIVWEGEAWVADVVHLAEVVVQQHKTQSPETEGQEDEHGYSHGSEGFRESDPYKNHPWRFDNKQARLATILSNFMLGGSDTSALEQAGINTQEIAPILAEVDKEIHYAYEMFLERLRTDLNLKDKEDEKALLEPDSMSVKMLPLLGTVSALVARYIIQSYEGYLERLNSEKESFLQKIHNILSEGFHRYVNVHTVDIPLYDKLYEEFDNLRETGRSPLEVYLGRDGIYAYIGRRAQDVARRRKLGPKGRMKLKEIGEVIEIHPRYVVYPRYFRDNMNYETKRKFLEQEGISPNADPLFYDTGYTGTIPEQIMKVMDFQPEDIEKRIRLLSAPSVHRRIKGIPENARQEVIEHIEHNAKTEETAEGLIVDEKTGKIRHIAKPTTPEEQFYFMMVKQAIARHYWLQEQLHHEPSGNVNLDSEHYTIRIRQDYANLLPQEFLRDPKTFFAQHGEILKSSKGEGEYPDEEVLSFKLTDGTEIVAKRIELRKAKEARKEFTILISAQKAGLPTAEPVGFLSGKEEADGSYLLMKKLEGRSGRKFEKELKESGKYSDEQVRAIMQQVTEKNKEMAELFRTTLKIDKRWRIKDTIIEFNEETGIVDSVIPIDWERAQNYDPSTPKEIDEIG